MYCNSYFYFKLNVFKQVVLLAIVTNIEVAKSDTSFLAVSLNIYWYNDIFSNKYSI